MNLDENSLLAVIVTDGGLIKNQIIRINKPPSIEVLNKIWELRYFIPDTTNPYSAKI